MTTTTLSKTITIRIRRHPLRGPSRGIAMAATALVRWAEHLKQVTSELVAEVERRGGETTIDHAPSQGCAAYQVQRREIQVIDVGVSEGQAVYLLRASGWRYYSRSFGARPARLAYLAGWDDNGPWAARVPGTMTEAWQAIDYLTPKTVQRARKAGRRVLRQGDIYAVETARRYDGSGLAQGLVSPGGRVWIDGVWAHLNTISAIGAHEWHPRARVLIHADRERPHAPLRVPFPARFIQQRALQMGRGAGTGAAD